jgi:precorrin-2 dehydrogenase / sirohydrochlorin ferrochelatase
VSGAFGFPVFLEVRGRVALVAGDGHEARAKAASLAELGASVRRFAPDTREWYPALLDGAFLAIVGTGDRELDRRIATDARAAGVLVNTIDDIAYCDWSAPAILRRGDLTVAVASAGIAPALAVRLRDRFADEIGPEYGELLALFGEVRPAIMATGRPFRDRRELWYRLVDGPALDHVREGRPDGARRAIADAIETWEAQP